MTFVSSIKRFFIKLFIYGFLITSIITFGLFYYHSKNLPDYHQLTRYNPPSVTRIYSVDGKLIEEYATEHRVFVPIESIPKSLIEAFIASEDKNFYSHSGIDFFGIIRAMIANVGKISQNKRMQGASTITQQVVKNILLSSEYAVTRKIKEAILSYRISKIFTKEKILELYLNQIYLGMRSYGVAIAAQNYFNKSIDELTLEESAFIAGIAKGPENFNPRKYYERAKERRDYVISRMLDDGYITRDAAKDAIEKPIVLRKRDPSDVISADYFAEEVRSEVIRMLGKEVFLNNGLTIITSLNSKYQIEAEKSFRSQMEKYDRSRGYRGRIAKVSDVKNFVTELRQMDIYLGDASAKLAVVLDNKNKKLIVGLADNSKHTIEEKKIKWCSSTKSINDLFKIGDVVSIKVQGNDYDLYQTPKVNGGMLVMDYSNGQILAMVGGYDFKLNKFNRATQAKRQPGSTAKTFVYLSALEQGIKPNRIFNDGPIEISQGPGMPKWKPKNYKGDFLGDITMRTGFEKSRNLITIRVAQAAGLNSIGDLMNRFGVNETKERFFSMVLGAIETTLFNMTRSYSIIANYGYEVTPSYIELIKDHNGKVLYRRPNQVCFNCDKINKLPEIKNSKSRSIIDEATSYQMISLMEGAATRGAAVHSVLKRTIAGKTGTTNKSKDVWYIGFASNPKVIVGTYVGYDTPKELGKTVYGATLALPIFNNFMPTVLEKYEDLSFRVPENIELKKIDVKTGGFYDGPGSIYEAFKIRNNKFKSHDDNEFYIKKDDLDIFERKIIENDRDKDQKDYESIRDIKEENVMKRYENNSNELGEEY